MRTGEVTSTQRRDPVRALPRVKAVWISVLVLLALAGTVMAMFNGPLVAEGEWLWPLTWISWPVVGGVILVRRPGNRIGIACLAIGLMWGLAFALQSVVLEMPDQAAVWIELVYQVLGVVPWLIIAWLLANFPTGEPAGRLERVVTRSIWVIGSWATLGFVLSPAPLEDTGLANPLGVADSPVFNLITDDSGFFFVLVLATLAVTSLVRRLRRSSGTERLQFRWLLFGGSIFVLIVGLGQVLPDGSGVEYLWFLGGSAIPISIGVAVIRYRLFEIDRIVSRTVAYVIVVGILAGVFAAAVTLTTSLLQTENDLAIAASTLAVAALFNPVRRRVQDWVDRRFNRSHYDAEQVMAGFTGSLRDQVDPDLVVSGWVSVINETMHPSSAGVWVRKTLP